ncbi:MAG: DUF4412 domain-containing protein [Acidobacteria bacterium]|nr:DUF4412 domain-containing protein [Acidobacteriota bacterium]
MTTRLKAAAGLAALIVTFGGCTTGPVAGPTNTASNSNSAQPVFEPGSAPYIALHQPDYRATVTVTTGPLTYTGAVARKGDRWKVELPIPPLANSTLYVRPGEQTILLMPETKRYVEFPAGQDGSVVNPMAMTLEGLTKPGIRFEQAGTETVDGRTCTKYRATREGDDAEMTVFVAKDLKDLIVRIDGRVENKTFSATWANPTLEVTDADVAPPADLASAFTKMEITEFQSVFASGAESAPGPAKPQ